MKKILIVYHTLGGNTEAAALVAEKALKDLPDTEVRRKKAGEATLEDLLWCDGLIVGSGDYFSYMAGALKDFFDRTFYPSRGKVEGKPCFAFLTHGGGGAAISSLEAIARSFKFKRLVDPVLIKGRPDAEAEKRLVEAVRKFAAFVAGS
ncbi:MAG TPA: NAD(P)H-dependent oxidoreductase [bacterium]|nr:NAD(P)H-dependent oxidoreductase [bacterium]HOL65825.1 NAD(P)H-dependent oxidoreductase [bacterium]HPP13541.1 NAD(P)H-dependent oxidoreductase [bacterium]